MAQEETKQSTEKENKTDDQKEPAKPPINPTDLPRPIFYDDLIDKPVRDLPDESLINIIDT